VIARLAMLAASVELDEALNEAEAAEHVVVAA